MWENKDAVDDPGSRVTEQCFAKTQDIQHRPHSPFILDKKHPYSFITKGQGLGNIMLGIASTEFYKFIWLLQDQDAKDQYQLCKFSRKRSVLLLILHRNMKFIHFFFLWRGFRSGVQLSCTETRLQKCPQRGKNGSKHPMLSISVAYNLISCKEIKETLKKTKSLILLSKFGSRPQK